MGGIFNPEGKFAHYGGKLADLMWLNLLVLLCSVPVVTAGASLSAMHYVLLKLHRDEDISVTKGFFKSFRDNLKQSVILLGIFVIAVYLMICGIRIAYFTETYSAGRYLAPLGLVMVMSIYNWALILQSRYQNTILGTIRVAMIMTLGHPIRSLLILILAVIPVAMLFAGAQNLIIVFMAAVSFTGLLQTVLYNGILYQLEHRKENPSSADE